MKNNPQRKEKEYEIQDDLWLFYLYICKKYDKEHPGIIDSKWLDEEIYSRVKHAYETRPEFKKMREKYEKK